MALFLSALTLFGLGGCKKKPVDTDPSGPISGGTVDKTDPDAPKTIRSRDIAEFYASFFLETRWTAAERRAFTFRIEPDETGAPVAEETGSGLRFPADDALLNALQAVVEETGLAARNGVYRVTAGLAPEYQACDLRIVYASGEVLWFTVNNDPTALWSEKIYDVFAAWFAAQGDASLFPAAETAPVTALSLFFTENGRTLIYETEDGEDAAALLQRTVYDEAARKTVGENSAARPEDFGQTVSALFARYDLSRRYAFSAFDHEAGDYGNHDKGYYGMGDRPAGETDAEDLSLTLHLGYEDGETIQIETRKPSEIEGMRAMLRELFAYLDAVTGVDPADLP